MGFKTQIAKLLGVAIKDVEAAITADSILTIDGTLFTDTELETNNNKIKDAAIAATKTETLKEISTKIGIDVAKTEDLSTALAEKYSDEDSKAEIVSLTSKLMESGKEIETLTTQLGSVKKDNTRFLKNEKLGSIIPSGYSVSKEDIRDLYSLRSNVGIDEQGELFFKTVDGKAKTDKKNKVVRPTTEDVTAFLETSGIAKKDTTTPPAPGRPPRTPNAKYVSIEKVSDIEVYAKENNIKVNSDEYRSLVTEVYTENPDIAK